MTECRHPRLKGTWINGQIAMAPYRPEPAPVSFAELLYGNPRSTQAVLSLLQELDRQAGRHVRRR